MTTTRRARRLALSIALLATTGLLASCSSSDSDGTAEPAEVVDVQADVTIVEATTTTAIEATTTTTAASTTTAPLKADIASVEFATSLEPNGTAIGPTTEFSSDNTVIYASVQVKPLPEGAVIRGEYAREGEVLTDASITSPADFDDIHLQFKLTAGGTFAPGEYTFTPSIDGEAGTPLTFTITG